MLNTIGIYLTVFVMCTAPVLVAVGLIAISIMGDRDARIAERRERIEALKRYYAKRG